MLASRAWSRREDSGSKVLRVLPPPGESSGDGGGRGGGVVVMKGVSGTWSVMAWGLGNGGGCGHRPGWEPVLGGQPGPPCPILQENDVTSVLPWAPAACVWPWSPDKWGTAVSSPGHLCPWRGREKGRGLGQRPAEVSEVLQPGEQV